LRAAFVPTFLRQKVTKPNCSQKKKGKTLSYEKDASKMLMKLTQGK